MGLKYVLKWNPFYQWYPMIKIRPLWDWNDTDEWDKVRVPKLKSDHCGIEIFKYDVNSMYPFVIKIRPLWDWNSFFIVFWYLFIFIKIRPLWDWNVLTVSVLEIMKILKSDHCGIEMIVKYLIYIFFRILKSDHCGIEIGSYCSCYSTGDPH